MSEITLVLQAVGRGESNASEDLFPLVYQELRQLAAARMAQEAEGQTLQPTALVHEGWLRLVSTGEQNWQNREHFFRTAARVMRCILIDNACRHRWRGRYNEDTDLSLRVLKDAISREILDRMNAVHIGVASGTYAIVEVPPLTVSTTAAPPPS